MTRKYSSISVETTLATGISSSATTMTVATSTASSLMGGVTLTAGNVDQFTVAIDPDTINEEIVFVTGVTSDTLTVVRGRAGSTAITHSGGAVVRHVLTSDDLNYFETNINATTLTGKTINLASNTVTGTTAQFNTALSDNDFATLAGTETLTNKDLSSATNTLSTSVVTLTGAQTLTNKTLTAPKIASAGFIADANGNEEIIFTTTASAVNEITVANAATGTAPTITASGGDTNVSLNLVPKGTGTLQANGVPIVTTTGTQTLTNKTIDYSSNTITNLPVTTFDLTFNAQTGTTYTLALTDKNKFVTLSNASAITLTVPPSGTAAFTQGMQIHIQQIGTGQVTISQGAGVTITSTGATSSAPKLRAQYSSATIICTGTSTFTVVGDIA